MLPVPMSGVGGIQLPQLPPIASGPHASTPGTFGGLYDQMSTVADKQAVTNPAIPQLPTSMEMRPILMPPSTSLSQPFEAASVEFPDAANSDGLQLPGTAKTKPVNPGSKPDKTQDNGPFQMLEPLKSAVQDASNLQANADKLTNEAAIGGDVDLHDVMIAGEKASVALQLTLAVRNKLIDAYQEVMRMQV